MRVRRPFPILLAVVAVAAILTFLVQLRKHAPPESARLLPSADGFFFINLQWMRRASVAGQLPAVTPDPDYEKFIEATGFDFEKDLDEAACAIHYPAKAPPGAALEPARFSWVLVGKIEGERTASYLRSIAKSVDNYKSIDIFNIPLEGRTLRVAILGVDTVAASNNNDPHVIEGIVDRSRKLASPFGGPAFLRQYYKEVPLASLSWAILKVDPSQPSMSGAGWLNFGFLFPRPATLVASVRYLGSVHLRAEAFTLSEDDARNISAQVSTYLDIFHAAETSVSAKGPDPDVKAFLDSLRVSQHKDQAVLTATIPEGFLHKMFATPGAPAQSPPAPVPEPKPSK